MKLLVLTHEPPLPANHGGRVDVYRRLLAFQKAGVSVFLAYFGEPNRPDLTVSPDIAALADGSACFRRKHYKENWREMARLPEWAVQRHLRCSEYQSLLQQAKAYAPDFVFLDGIYCGNTAIELAKNLGIDLLYRSHNVEHQYAIVQRDRAANWKEKCLLTQNAFFMKKLEEKVFKSCKRFFDISIDDLAYWRGRGHGHGVWLPTMIASDFANRLQRVSHEPQYDIGYVGNLSAANNKEGVHWFLNQVLPLIRLERPAASIFVAGSNPDDDFAQAIRSTGVHLEVSPADITQWLVNAKVLINPVFAGSGVNVKSVEGLFTNAHLVTTKFGVAGLPKDVSECFEMATTPHEFATKILAGLEGDRYVPDAKRVASRKYFSDDLIQTVVNACEDEGPVEYGANAETAVQQ